MVQVNIGVMGPQGPPGPETRSKVVATSNQALTGLPVIDGYQTLAGDQVLLVAQSTPAQNGLWVVGAGAWARPADFANGLVILGRTAVVSGGATNAGSVWTLSTTGTVTIGTTAQVWINAPAVGLTGALASLTAADVTEAAARIAADSAEATTRAAADTAEASARAAADALRLTITAPTFTSGAALQAALDDAAALGQSEVRVGDMNIGSTVVTVPPSVDLVCVGLITTTGNGGLVFDSHIRRHHRIKIQRATTDWDEGTDTTSVGIQVRNCNWNTFELVTCRNFRYGIHLLGDGAGTVNNKFFLGDVVDNQVGIQPAILNAGWVNQNTFFAGQVRVSGSGLTGLTRAVSNVAVTSNVATVTTLTPHGLVLSSAATPNLPFQRSVTITGLTNAVLNGTWVVASVPSTTTITFAVVTGDIASTADSGTMSGVPVMGTRGVAACLGGNGFNTNTFVGTNFEGPSPERTVDLNAPYNTFVGCRWEGATGVWLSPNAGATVFLGGYQVRYLPIVDSTNNAWEMYGEGVFHPASGFGAPSLGSSRTVPNGAAPGLFRLDHLGAAGKEYRLVGSGSTITATGLQAGTLNAHVRVRLGAADECYLTHLAAARIGTDSSIEFQNHARWLKWFSGVGLFEGSGSPEGVQTAPVGSLYLRRDGAAGTSLYLKETGTGNTGWVPITTTPNVTTLDTVSYSGTTVNPALGDAGKVIEATNAAAISFVIPLNATVPYPVGTVLEVRQMGAGQVTVSGEGGVTVQASGNKLKTSAQYAACQAHQRAANTWVVSGDLIL